MNEIDNIPKSLRIAIYGAGEVGLFVKHYIENNRPDLKLISFFDKIEKTDIEGLTVHPIKKIQELKKDFDLVIVASYSNIAIMETILRYHGIDNYVHLDDFCLNQAEIENEPCTFSGETDKIAEVQKILFSEESKNLFELIVAAYKCKHCLKKLSNYLKENNKAIYPKIHEQYLDFIDKNSIKTIISAGAYDAGTSLLFLDRLKNVEKIYAFEPMYDKFKCELNDSIIAESGKVEIIKKGVFDKSGEISFVECDNSSAADIGGIWNPSITINIQTISIDDFIKEKNIKKVDFIKMDVEGCELAALKGAKKTIIKHHPQLAICIYHSYEELFDIPNYLYKLLPNYKFEVYHYSLNNIWESVLYGIPDEVNSKQ